MLLNDAFIKKDRKNKKGCFSSWFKEKGGPVPVVLSYHDISSFASVLFAEILLQMNHSCVKLSVFFEVFLFLEIMRTKYQNVWKYFDI